jgi:hypothetical protein
MLRVHPVAIRTLACGLRCSCRRLRLCSRSGGDCCLRTCEENCGIASSASPSTCFTLENTGFIGGDYSNAAASSVAECCATCAADTQCKLAVLVDGTCYLKDATAVLSQSQSGSTSIYPGPHPGYHCEYDCSVTTSGHECRDARYATVPAVYGTTLCTCPDPPAAVAPGDGFCNSANNVAPCFEYALSRSEPWLAASAAQDSRLLPCCAAAATVAQSRARLTAGWGGTTRACTIAG